MSRQGQVNLRSLDGVLVGAAWACGLLAVLAGAVHLAAWLFLGPAILLEWTGPITMKTNTALGLLLAGSALLLLIPKHPAPWRRRIGRACAAAVLSFGLLTFSEHLAGWDLGIDQLLASEPPAAAAVMSPNRMGPPASASFALLGIALLLLSRRRRGRQRRAAEQPVATAVALLALLPTIGYLFGADQLYGIARYTGIAWPTAVALLCLALGLLFSRPREGLMASVTADDPGGRSIRRLLPPLVTLPLLLGWLRLEGERHGLFDAALGTGLMMLLWILLFIALVFYTARGANLAAAALRASDELNRRILHALPAHVAVLDTAGRIIAVNEAWLQFARTNAAAEAAITLGANYLDVCRRAAARDDADAVRALAGIEDVLRGAAPSFTLEYPCHSPAEQRWFLMTVAPLENNAGGAVITHLNITARKQAEQRARLLSDVTAELLASSRPQEIVDTLCRKVMAALDCHAFFNYLIDEPTGRLHLNACTGVPEETVRRIEWLDVGVAVCGCAARDACRIVAENIQTSHDPRAALVRSFGIQAYACHPLLNQGAVIGTLSFGSRSKTSFTDEELGLMKAVADHVSIAMQRLRLLESLERHAEAAQAANVAKSRFLANMSHELRTPMNAILGMIDVALPKAIDPTVQDCLATAKSSAGLLLTLLDDLLDSAKIEAGKLALEAVPFGLRRMLEQLTRTLALRANEKGLSFACRAPADTPDAVIGDRVRLQQVLLNLAGNAIKFTERGEVRVEVRPLVHDGHVDLSFTVRDTGIGIEPERLAILFEPFTQADASTTRRFGGSGLGLSICKSLVELMGGAIHAESRLGEGSAFSFSIRLPLAQELPAEYEPRALVSAPVKRLRILLVEDNPANQKLAKYILQDRGHAVEVADDGREALELSARHRYDVILMDAQMPGMDGLEATVAIRKRENGNGRVPIVALTAHALPGDRDRCLAAGMDGYLAKPINAQQMIAVVESLAAGAAPPLVAELPPDQPVPVPSVFDIDQALATCCRSESTLAEMIACFDEEFAQLFPKMRAALEQGDLVVVGRLGHRLKGTLVYLGAQSAQQAARHVEEFSRGGGAVEEAAAAVSDLERECHALHAVLDEHLAAVSEPR